jgi:hypothetical protein
VHQLVFYLLYVSVVVGDTIYNFSMLFVAESHCLKSVKHYNCPNYNKLVYILLLQILRSPVWLLYIQSVCDAVLLARCVLFVSILHSPIY